VSGEKAWEKRNVFSLDLKTEKESLLRKRVTSIGNKPADSKKDWHQLSTQEQ